MNFCMCAENGCMSCQRLSRCAVRCSVSPHPWAEYLFRGSSCRAATTPPRAAAERFTRTAQFAGNPCAAGRGATRRSATSSTTLNRYEGEGKRREQTVAYQNFPATLELRECSVRNGG